MRNKQGDVQSREPVSSGGHRAPGHKPDRPTLADLVGRARFEVLPTSGVVEQVLAHLPVERVLTVTASPGRGLEATLEVAEALAGHGYRVVPHLAARMVVDRAHLQEIVDRLREAGIDDLFVPGGDADVIGDYADATSLLRDLAALDRPFGSIGITAYPESHPSIPDDRTIQAMWDKRDLATELVSNITFDPEVVGSWLARVRGRGVGLPLWLGVPGPSDPAKLLAVATRIGVGESTRFLVKNRRTVARLLRPGGFSSQDFLRRLEPVLIRPESRVTGLHVFTFNQLAATEAWRADLLGDLRRRGRRPGLRIGARAR